MRYFDHCILQCCYYNNIFIIQLQRHLTTFINGYYFSACRIICSPHRQTYLHSYEFAFYALLCTRGNFALFSQGCDVHHTLSLLFIVLCGHLPYITKTIRCEHSVNSLLVQTFPVRFSPSAPLRWRCNSQARFRLILHITTIQHSNARHKL
jgi:hypothetical protein